MDVNRAASVARNSMHGIRLRAKDESVSLDLLVFTHDQYIYVDLKDRFALYIRRTGMSFMRWVCMTYL